MHTEEPLFTTTTPAPEGGARSTPQYKLAKKLAELDLRLRYPTLSRRWRRRMAAPLAEQTPVPRGRQGAEQLERERAMKWEGIDHDLA